MTPIKLALFSHGQSIWNSDSRYEAIDEISLPLNESLKDNFNRMLPYWIENIVPEIKAGKKVIISAHGKSLRGIIKYLDNTSDEEIPNLEIPTGRPLIYELDENLSPLKHYYLD